jgi:hypothetical protein
MKTATYAEVRPLMLPCDLIAFSGRGLVSTVIKKATRSEISHVGGVAIGGLFDSQEEIERGGESDVDLTPQNGRMVLLYESTTLDGADGVRVLRMSDAIPRYLSRGYRVYWYPMRADLRQKFDCVAANDWLFRQLGKRYDVRQAINAAPFMRKLFTPKEDLGRLFCSEMQFGSWRAGGLDVAALAYTLEEWRLGGLFPSMMVPDDCARSYIVDQDVAREVTG